MVARFGDRDRRAELVAAADPEAELELVVEAAARPIVRRVRIRRLALPAGAHHRLARRPHRARPAVVADRHIFVVGQQRAFGPELATDIGRVVDADVEVGVVADQAGHVHPHLALADQARLDIVAVALVAEQLGKAQPKVAMGVPAARQPAVQDGLGEIAAPALVEQVGDGRQIEDVVADGDAGPAAALGFGEDPERQVLHRKIASGPSARNPADARGVVRLVERHGSFALGKPAQASS